MASGARSALRGGLLQSACGAALALVPSRCSRLQTCTRRASLADVVQLMVASRVHQLVVVDERSGVYDGVVTAAHVMRFLAP